MKAGKYMEAGILTWWSDETGRQLDVNPGLHADDEYPWLIGTPDALIVGASKRERIGVVDAKNVDRMFKDEWGISPPLEYTLQVMGYQRMFGLKEGWLAACFGGNELLSFQVPYNEELMEAALESAQEWWIRHVEGDVEPPATATEASMRAWRKLHPQDNGEVVLLGEQFVHHRDRLAQIGTEIKTLETEAGTLKQEVLNVIGDATFGQLPDGSGWSFKTSTINHKAKEAYQSEQRTLRAVKRAAP